MSSNLKVKGSTTLTVKDPTTKEDIIVTNDPAVKEKLDKDPGLCGIGILHTGKWDPMWKYKTCTKHDAYFNEVAEGKRKDWGIAVALEFTRDAVSTWLKSLYGVIAAPIYVPLIWLVGLPRYAYLRLKAPKTAQEKQIEKDVQEMLDKERNSDLEKEKNS